MKFTADTNVLVHAVVQDDARQASQAQALLAQAVVIAIPVPVFCEFAWVLRRTYNRTADEIATAIRAFIRSETVATDLPAVEAGLRILQAGGDFADGVIAHQGESLGGSVFVSFDRRAVARLRERGVEAAEPSEFTSAG
ncbi:MAG: type II toxin-antitoxin system VapC family toxin [Acidobacteria bacterium]|nr:type II toxin-antitoxin system VapC family toxin [Acidobacteriota bacterium]MYE42471.1 type II toxin-antitoxin system VapC family toxin [Acidobacteriota bacterium]MYH21655.1 type II toxin-antitoxin system VapC family toxin [Acidobacteriota bacterium]MYK78291.1 type II toxin-antitoxin system VapC family toxin [Acidobacteriota bacterium]